jgi:ABC-type bacteriocin/lantibiotic exporter with double-glycine peptidase domain/CRP-like cAMP-binding protein
MKLDQADNIKKIIQHHNNSLFSSLSIQQVKWIEREITPKLEVVKYKFGEDIVRPGDRLTDFYLITEGKARVIDRTKKKNITLAVLTPGSSFGECSLLSSNLASTTVRASSELTLLKLNKTEFNHLIDNFPAIKDKLISSIQQQAEFRFFRTLSFFSALKLSEAYKYRQEIQFVKLEAGEFLFKAGEAADAAYVVRSGTIRLVKEKVNDVNDVTLAIIKTGDICGETALLFDCAVHPLSAISSKNTVICCLPRQSFREIVSYPKIKQELTQIAGNRRLQYEAILASGNKHDTQDKLSNKLNLKTVKLNKKRLFAPSLTFTTVDNPLLAGIACLSTINLYFKQQIDLQPLVESQLIQEKKENLISISRHAESFGYLTCLLNLNDERLDKVFDLPAIVEYNNVLCLLLSVADFEITLVNPVIGIVKCDRYEEFNNNWNGKLLTFKRVPNLSNFGDQTQEMFQQSIPWLRSYGQILVWVLIISFASQLLGLAEPLFSQVIIDGVLDQDNYSLLWLILSGMLIVTAFQLVGSSLEEILVTQAMKRISISLLLQCFQHILSLPKVVFSQWQVGDFTVRLQENENLLQLVSQSGFTVVINSITSLFYLLILLNQNAKLTSVALIFVLAYALVLIVSTPLLRANDRKVFECHRRSQSHLIATLTGIETVKSTATENLFFQEGIELIVKSHLAEFKGALLSFNLGLISSTINLASTICLMGYGALLTLPFPSKSNIQPELTLGELVAFNAILGLLLGSLQSLVGVWDEIQQIKISFDRINDVFALPIEKQDPTAIMSEITGRVRLENVHFRYENSDRDVLQDINLEVFPGEKIAIVGKSGSGKTTLVNLLIKLLEPTQGKIYIDNIDISNIELSSYRCQLGVVEQQPFLFNGTVRENIAKVDLSAKLETVVKAGKLAGADEFIKSLPLQYDTQIGERGITLSGGQKQRVIIARALLTSPRILILDEPTASLDSDSERIILENLARQTAGRTSFLVAHRLSTVLHADKIIVLDRGRIIETGTHSQLLAEGGFYANLYQHGESSSLVSCQQNSL